MTSSITARARGIVFVPFRPLHVDGSPALDAVARSHAATPGQIALAWLLHRSPVIVPIPGTLSIAHVKENVAALDIELSDEEIAALDSGSLRPDPPYLRRTTNRTVSLVVPSASDVLVTSRSI